MIMTELKISTHIEWVNDNNDLQIYQWAHFTIDIIGYKWNLYLNAFIPFLCLHLDSPCCWFLCCFCVLVISDLSMLMSGSRMISEHLLLIDYSTPSTSWVFHELIRSFHIYVIIFQTDRGKGGAFTTLVV